MVGVSRTELEPDAVDTIPFLAGLVVLISLAAAVSERSAPFTPHQKAFYLTLAEVKRADASAGRGPRQEVPMLAEVLDLLGPTGTGVDLEIKNLPGEAAYDTPREACLVAALEEAGEALLEHARSA